MPNKKITPPIKKAGNKYTSLILHTFFISILLCSIVLKNTFWGLHYWNYISYIYLGIYIIIYIISSVFAKSNVLIQNSPVKKKDIIIAGVICMSISIFYYCFTIKTDIYGDHRQFLKNYLSNVKDIIPSAEWLKLLSPRVLTKHNGESFIFSLAKLITYYTGCSIPESFRRINFFAALFFYTFLIKLLREIFAESKALFYTFIFLSISGGFTLFFHGYIEVYPMALAIFMCYLYYLYMAFKKNTIKRQVICFLFLLICIKSNSAGFLLIPSFITLIIHQRFKINLNLKRCILFIFLPICIVGTFLYVFIFPNIVGSQIVKPGSNQILTMFLPLISDKSPHSNYTLFSLFHILDYLNVILFCSLGGCAVIIHNILVGKADKIKNSMYYIALVQVAIFITFYFMINPLLSMVRDFDLYTLMVPTILFFAILSTNRIRHQLNQKFIILVIIIGLFQIPVHVVNINKDLIKYRLEDTGYHVYKTYWVGSSYILNVSANYDMNDTTQYIQRRLNIVKNIKPMVSGKNDQEYALLLSNLANIYFQTKDYNNAYIYFNMAARQTPTEQYIEYAAYCLYNQNKKEDAYKYIYSVIPTTQNQNLLKFYIRLTVDLKKYQECLNICLKHNSMFPNDKSMIPLTLDLQKMFK